MVPQEDLWIRTAWKSAEGERRSLSTGGEQSGNTRRRGNEFYWYFSCLLCVCMCTLVCVCVCVKEAKIESERDWPERHQTLLLPARINCISVTGFHSSSLMPFQVTPWLFYQACWDTSNSFYLWPSYGFSPSSPLQLKWKHARRFYLAGNHLLVRCHGHLCSSTSIIFQSNCVVNVKCMNSFTPEFSL